MAGFFDTKAPQQFRASGLTGLVDRASASPLNAIGRTMSELDAIATERGKEQYSAQMSEKMKGLKSVEDMMGLGVDLSRGTDAFGEQFKAQGRQLADLEKLKQLQEAQDIKYGTEDQRGQAGQILSGIAAVPEKFQTLESMLGVKEQYADNPAVVTALDKIIEQQFPEAGATGRPTSLAEIQRGVREYGLTNKWSPDRIEKEVAKASYDWAKKSSVGTNQFGQNIDEVEMGRDYATLADDEYRQVLSNPKVASPTQMGNMKSIERRMMNNITSEEANLAKKKMEAMSGNHLVANNIQDVLNYDAQGKYDKIDKGIIGNPVQGLQKLLGGKMSQDNIDAMNQQIDLDTRKGVILASYIKAISGTAASQAEIDRLTGLFEGGKFADEETILQAMRSFQGSMKDANDNLGGQLFDTAPHSATKYRQYKEQYKSDKPAKKVIDGRRVGQTYTDAEGNKAVLQADGTWKEI